MVNIDELSSRNPSRMAYTVQAAADLLSVSRSHMYELIQSGKIQSIKIGKSRRITSKQLDAYLAQQETTR